jgi:phospholipid transport system transporter-binding protein
MSALSTSFTVSGELVFSTVWRWRREGQKYIAKSDQPLIDFNNINLCDSSAVALLLAWLRDAKESGKVLRFANTPQQLLNVARVYGVLDLLNGKTTNG